MTVNSKVIIRHKMVGSVTGGSVWGGRGLLGRSSLRLAAVVTLVTWTAPPLQLGLLPVADLVGRAEVSLLPGHHVR